MRGAVARFSLLGLIFLGLAASTFGHSTRLEIDADVIDIITVSSTAVSKTETDFKYRIKVANRGRMIRNAVAYVSLDRRCNLRYTRVMDNEVPLGTLAAGTITTSADTFTIRQNKNERFSNACIVFTFYGDVVNTPPVANAGPDQTVKVGAIVTLDGTRSSDADGDRLRYTWKMTTKPSGSKAVLSSDCNGRITFKVDKAGTYVFTLVVNDGRTNSAPDEVRITTANAAPVANAGPDRTVPRSTLVKLDGSASSDPNNDLLTYRWTIVSKPVNSTAALANATNVKPGITLDQPGNYTFKLIVNDGQLDSAPDTVTLSTENSAPVADAGPDQNVRLGVLVTLNGSASSDVDGDPLSMSWTWQSIPDGSKAVLAGDTSVTPSFTPDVAGLYVVQLIVNDGYADSAPDTTSVTIDVVNQPPHATADAASTAAGTAVDIDVLSNDSDPDPGTTLRIESFTQPGSGGTVAANGSKLRFTPAAGFTGQSSFQYTISDGALTATATVNVTVTAVNAPPVVKAGANQSLTLDSSGTVTATLTGTVTDDGLPAPPHLTFTWSQASGPVAATLMTPAASTTQVKFTQAGTYTLRLTASDGALSAQSDVQVTVAAAANSPPMLAPIGNRTVAAGTALVIPLIASDSNAGDQLSFEMTTSPAGAQLLMPAQVLWTPTSLQIGTHSFSVSVHDTAGATDTRSFQITVTVANHAPTLASLTDDTTVSNATYSKLLSASDPDGDALTYDLLSGPSGMTLSGSQLNWKAPAANAGPFTVSVRVTDPQGASASAIFKISMVDSTAPHAADDTYTVKVGGSLTVPAAGVLTNDVDANGSTLTALKQSDPALGTLSAFGANGGFTYTAPSIDPRQPFAVTARPLTNSIYINDLYTNPTIGDVNKDGYPDLVYDWFNANHTAISGKDGSVLWHAVRDKLEGCFDWLNGGYQRVLADIDDDGNLEYVIAVQCADARLAVIDGTGHTKWVSASATQPYSAIQCFYGNGYCPPDAQPVAFSMLDRVAPSVARLTPNSAPVILFRRTITADAGTVLSPTPEGPLAWHSYGCALATGRESDIAKSCAVTFIMSTADGSIQQVLTAPPQKIYGQNLAGLGPYQDNFQPPFTADLDGDGQVEIISGGDVWHLVSSQWTLAWQSAVEPEQVVVADLDGDGRAEVIHFHARASYGPYNGEPLPGFDGFIIYDADGVEQRRIPLLAGFASYITIADVDGDATPEFLVYSSGMVHAVSIDGFIKWSFLLPDSNVNPAPYSSDFRGSRQTNIQAYDLDGDGVKEVVVSSLFGVHILDGRNGTAKVNFEAGQRIANAGAMRFTFVTDWDNDGHADIVSFAQGNGTLGGAGSWVLTDANNSWLPAPKSFHQTQFRAGDIDDNGHVNYNAGVSRSFRNPQQLGTIRDPRESGGTSFEYTASNGSATSNTAKVFLDIVPDNSPPVITSRPPSAIQASSTEDYLYQLTATDPDVGDTVTYSILSAPSWVHITPSGAVTFDTGPCGSYGGACEYGHNLIALAATDSRGAQSTQSFMVNVTLSSTTVPDVVGVPLANARQIAQAALLNPQLLQEQYSSKPAGTVIAQGLPASSSAPYEALFLLTVSKGLAPVPVPAIVGRGLAGATDTLASLGLVVHVTPVFSPTVPPGQVLSQSPAFGTSLAPASTVELTVSAGPQITGSITRMTIEPSTAYRLTGETQAFKAIGELADGTRVDVSLAATWTSGTAAVASVDALGRAQALAAGTSAISASFGGKSSSTTLHVAQRVGTDAIDPTAAITAPAEDSTVTGPVAVKGTATDANFLRYTLTLSSLGSTQATLIGAGTAPVTNDTLGELDGSALLNGAYVLTLTVFDRNNNQTSAKSSVTISGDRKVGLFSMAFRDVEIPVGGIPIVVTRVYDSRDKQQGDFGIGWRLGVQSLTVRTNRVLGTGWVRNQNGASVSLQSTGEHKVTLTLADGKLEEFDLKLSPTSNLGSLDTTRVVGFTPRSGTQGKLEMLGNTDLLIVSGGAHVELVDDETLNTFDPQLFRYTSVDGVQMEVSRSGGVQKTVDTNGNSLTIGPAGIIHSSGKSVKFARDFLGRITDVTDPMGRVQHYEYDGNGDLISHADPLGNSTRFVYDGDHGLVDVRDPLGRHALRNEYDAQGRLTATIDANGNRVTFEHNDAAQEDISTDRLGRQTRIQYDANGNVTTQTRAVTIEGQLVPVVTSYTYDADGNETSVRDPDGMLATATFEGTNPLARIIDPNGLALKTTYGYDASNKVSAVVDAGGRSYSFKYDAAGNVALVGTPADGTTTTESDSRGLLKRSLDAAGTLTTYTRDAAGNVTREEVTDSSGVLLRRVEAAYDANGNKTAETLYRTIEGVLTPVTTSYTYDAANRLTKVTDAAGGVSRIEYDAASRTTAKVDPLGRRTEYEYNSLGLLSRTTYPDNTFEELTYDLEGNILTQKDTSGRVTTFTYDELGRRIRTKFADGTSIQNVYSAGGRLEATIDQKGNRTDYVYDSAGRSTSTVLPTAPLGVADTPARPHVAREFTALGAVASMTDPNGHLTRFTFDASGRVIETTFADGGVRRQSFDGAGRRTTFINEDGETSSFGYDGFGRLTAVSGAIGTAAYTYDEAGNLVTQTDALGRVTRYRYDRLNRMIEKRYADGAREQFGYDAASNLISRTDANGKTTTFEYSALGQLITKTLPGNVIVRYTYTADGQRSSVTDSRGTTLYMYDGMGRLSRVTQPNGQAIDYTHDSNGNLSTLAAGGVTVSYRYDALNRLSGMTSPEGQHRYYYDAGGNRVRSTAPNGVTSDWVFDSRDRTTSLTHRSSQNGELDSFTNLYSAAGRLTQTTQQDGSVQRYGYDAFGRLNSETRTGTNPYTASYVYDAVGNRTQMTRNGATTTYTYNANDQLISDGSATFAYDANGNLVTRTGGGADTQYGYDGEDRLVSVAGGGANSQYDYDDDGNRVQATTAAGITRFLVDNANNTGLSQVLEERDGAGGLKARYAYGNDLASMTRNGVASFYLRDTNRNVRALSGTTGAVTDRYTYDGYGGGVGASGATDNPYRYSSQRLDADTGLYQLRARYYNPGSGRFLSRDPLPGRFDDPRTTHRYAYANSDPIQFSDPTGEESIISLTAAQAVNNTLEKMDVVGKVRAACGLKSTADQIDAVVNLADLAVFGLSVSTSLLAVSTQLIDGEEWGGFKAQSAIKFDAPYEWKPKGGRFGIEKLAVALAASGGKVAVKGTVSFKDKQRPTLDGEISGPPLSIKGALGLKGEKIDIQDYSVCGVKAGSLYLESAFKFYGGGASVKGKPNIGIGHSFSLDLKLSAFGDHFKVSAPLIGADLDLVKRKFTLYMLGGGLVHEL